MMKIFNKVTLNVKMLMAMALVSICVPKVFAHVSETASHLTALTVEELRIGKAEKALPIIADILTTRYENFTQQINKAKLLSELTEMALYHGNQLWQESVASLV
jgi:soluble P-type ATPase